MTSQSAIIVLNGAPRSGKSSIAKAIQQIAPNPFLNLGVDAIMQALPEKAQPGLGLRPGGERPDLEPLVRLLYRGLYGAAAAFAREGTSVVVDAGHHDFYSRPLRILPECAAILQDFPAMLVGVYCPLDIILQRREATGYPAWSENGAPLPPVLRWQEAVHLPGIYDIEVDTADGTPQDHARRILKRLAEGNFSAFAQLRA